MCAGYFERRREGNIERLNCFYVEMAHYVSEIDCRECAERHSIYKDCIWNSFITAASYEAFKGRNRFVKVIDWLEDLHEFSNKDISDMNREISNQLKTCYAGAFASVMQRA